MKERPIIMTSESVKAILKGRKTQTRRVVKPQPVTSDGMIAKAVPIRLYPSEFVEYCPPGQVGDRLWVRETWATESRYNNLKPSEVTNTAKIYYVDKAIHSAGGYSLFTEMGKVRPSIFMREWMSRITLEITGVRVERLQEIELTDIEDEGIIIPDELMALPNHKGKYLAIQQLFIDLWNSINAKRGYGWETNPWVWVIGFGGIGVRLK